MKLKGLVCALAAALCTVSTAGAQSLPAGPKITITAVTQAAPTIPQYTKVDVPMLRENMPKASNGRIEFNLKSWPEANVQGPEVIRLVRSGQVDIGGVPLTTVSGDVPILDGVDLAGLNPEIETAYKVAAAMVPIANRELERLGVRIVATYPYPAQVFFCRKPIAGLADFKGLKVRVNGPSPGDLMNALGAQPTALAFGEVYMGLKSGTIDAQDNPLPTVKAAKFYEVSKQIVLTSHLVDGLFIAISNKALQALSAAQRSKVQAAAQAAAAFNNENRLKEESQLVEFFKKEGLQISTPDLDAFHKAVQAAYQNADYGKIWPAGLLERINAVR
jgi:TRAP-type C4-dicarboxylate transport system substrate-binding protein